MEYGESAYDAVLRELAEEAGATCQVKRFLGCLEYSFEPNHNSICHSHEYNFIFELSAEELKIEKKLPHREAHIELIWLPLGQLDEIDFRPDPLKKLVPHWLKAPVSSMFSSNMI